MQNAIAFACHNIIVVAPSYESTNTVPYKTVRPPLPAAAR